MKDNIFEPGDKVVTKQMMTTDILYGYVQRANAELAEVRCWLNCDSLMRVIRFPVERVRLFDWEEEKWEENPFSTKVEI